MNLPKVLIADADEVYRRHLRNFLAEKDNFTIYDVGSGESAMNVAVKDQPNVVLLDIMLPDMSGIEVCRKLKTYERLKFVPVIIHTARIGLKDKLSFYLVGAHEYLAKPCNPDYIYESLQTALHLCYGQMFSLATVIERIRRS